MKRLAIAFWFAYVNLAAPQIEFVVGPFASRPQCEHVLTATGADHLIYVKRLCYDDGEK